MQQCQTPALPSLPQQKGRRDLKQPRNKVPIKPTPGAILSLRCLFCQKFLFLSVNNILPGKEICSQRRLSRGLYSKLIPEYHNKIQRNTQVASYKGDMVKLVRACRTFHMHESIEIFEDGDENAES